MQEAQNWRELLSQIIADPREKQRLIEKLHIKAITLSRWINGESEPRPQNLRHLMNALQPHHREQFRALITREKGMEDLANSTSEQIPHTIPSEFYARVLQARAMMNEPLRFWSTCQLILQQAIGQLDPNRLGMSIWVVRCMPPSGPYNKVRSMRESVGIGTPPWPGNLEQNAMFLGAESLAGSVATLCRPGIIQDIENELHMIPFIRVEYEKSAAIYPILYAGRIAGVFLVSSTQKHYFQSQARSDLVQYYSELVALAFDTSDFYPAEQIALCVMPKPEEQSRYFAHFRQRVAATMREAALHHQPVNSVQADILVWQKLEEEMLQKTERESSAHSWRG